MSIIVRICRMDRDTQMEGLWVRRGGGTHPNGDAREPDLHQLSDDPTCRHVAWSHTMGVATISHTHASALRRRNAV